MKDLMDIVKKILDDPASEREFTEWRKENGRSTQTDNRTRSGYQDE